MNHTPSREPLSNTEQLERYLLASKPWRLGRGGGRLLGGCPRLWFSNMVAGQNDALPITRDEGSRRRRALGVYKRDSARGHAHHPGPCPRPESEIRRLPPCAYTTLKSPTRSCSSTIREIQIKSKSGPGCRYVEVQTSASEHRLHLVYVADPICCPNQN